MILYFIYLILALVTLYYLYQFVPNMNIIKTKRKESFCHDLNVSYVE